MSGKFLFLILLAVLTVACGKRDHDRLYEQELTHLIDKKDYRGVLRWFDSQSDTEVINKFKVYKAYAYMGLGGLETIDFVVRVRSKQKFSDTALERFFVGCDNIELGKDFKDAEKCFTVRLFNQVPSADNPNLKEAREIFQELRSTDKLKKQDLLLMSFVETCFVLSRVKVTLIQYSQLDPNYVTHDQAIDLFNQVHASAEDMKNFVSALKQNRLLLTEKLTGSRQVKLFREDPEGRIEFLEQTGLPLFLRVSSMLDESTLARAGRNAIIQALDQALEFFVAPPQ